MAAAQVAKKLKDKRQQRTIEGIFKKVCRIYFLKKYTNYVVGGQRWKWYHFTFRIFCNI